MCGIVGYAGKDNACKILINGLKKLEYRGYDSAGIAVAYKETGEIQVIREVGKVKNLEEKVKKTVQNIPCIGIAHTRWATHGTPTVSNSHPHRCLDVTLVHNGIIENYTSLKEALMQKKVKFSSETDTEVACAEIAKTKGKTNLERIIKACGKMEGSYAFGIIFDGELDRIYATRRNSPLVIGLSKDGNCIASDVQAIINYTNKYIILDANEYACISKDFVKIYSETETEISKEILTADVDEVCSDKGLYDHYMLKEIHEQPDVMRKTFSKYKTLEDLDTLPDISKYSALHIIACGSAMHAGLIGKYLIEEHLKIPVTVEIASEYRYGSAIIPENTLAIILSQSGETADSLAALKLAKKHKAKVLSIVNVYNSSIARASDEVIYTKAGAEIAVATTKAYLAQVATLCLITLAAMHKKDNLTSAYKEKIQEIFDEMAAIPDKIQEILSDTSLLVDISKYIFTHEDLFYIGRNIDYALCMEGSLKIKEISYIHSEAYAAGELKHGSISLIEPGTPVISISTRKELASKTISNIKEVKARGAYSIFIAKKSLDTAGDFYDAKYLIRDTVDFLMPLLTIIPLQIISYETAKLRACDIDKPKNLAKSVTVE